MGINRYLLILIIIWTGGVVVSLGWNIYQLKQSILSVARTSAKISYDKDIIYRRWVARQGGVYVPVSELTPPNPYLNVSHRNIKTSAGRTLTLVNPAYMTRQVNELARELNNFQGHITSLNPIRPENYPDTWEREALKSFERGIKETDSLDRASGKEYFRYMSPFVMEKSCLKCHAAQGYKEGDIRGGISISIPMEPLRAVEGSRMIELTLAHSFLWVIGLMGIGTGARRLWHQILKREKAEEEVFILSQTDQLTGLLNRRGFLSLTEQQLKLSTRTKNRMIFFFVDMDGMKWINDTLGHKEGDNALIEVANILKEAFRSSDIIARMGGDEFATLAIDTREGDSEIMIGRLEGLIHRHNNQENRKYNLSVSVGCSIYDPENPCSIDEIMAKADQLMYEQKRSKKFWGQKSTQETLLPLKPVEILCEPLNFK